MELDKKPHRRLYGHHDIRLRWFGNPIYGCLDIQEEGKYYAYQFNRNQRNP